jgi:hypothetical protein
MEINTLTVNNLDNEIINYKNLNDDLLYISSYKHEKQNTSLKNQNNIDEIGKSGEIDEIDKEDDEKIDIDILKKMVVKWIKLDDKIKDYNKEIKDMKNEKLQMEDKILLFMDDNEQNEIQVKNDKLEKKKSETKEAINEEYIKKCLIKSIDDVEMVDKLTNIIISNRAITESYKLARKTQKKPNKKN